MPQPQAQQNAAAAMQAANSSSPSRRTVSDESTSMIERNPAPDSSPARAPTDSRTFTIRS